MKTQLHYLTKYAKCKFRFRPRENLSIPISQLENKKEKYRTNIEQMR